ncbi:MAG: asparagine synthase C-terminal domain-containing protein, partial [Desulfovibrio sp.]|nr:asparagine synthase C-terminal domain-containing protein [Desulfovibrio sp.]
EFFERPLSAEELFAPAVELYRSEPGLTELEQALMFFTDIYLPDDILVKSDRAAMMASLETRAVFLDNDIADFCERLPARFKYKNGERKYILKKALQGWLPADILNQPKKGFGIPLNRWLRSLSAPDRVVPGLKDGVVAACLEKHAKRAGDYRFFLWDLQAWSRMN